MPVASPCTCHTEKRVTQPNKDALNRRLNRITGQVQGIGKMVAEDRYCVDILVQVSAVRSALNQVAMQIVEDHTRGCVHQAIQDGQGEEAIDELMAVLAKFTK